MRSDEIKEFDEWAVHYDEAVRREHEFPFIGYEKVLDTVFELSYASPPCRVLDLGVGTGNLARRFLDHGCLVWGIDFSAKMLDLARVKIPEARLAQGDIRDRPPEEFPPRFDLLVSGYVFHHLDLSEKVTVIARLARENCEPGSRIVLADISFQTRKALDEARVRWSKVWEEEQYWVAEEAVPACEKAGLTVHYEQVVECAGIYTLETGATP